MLNQPDTLTFQPPTDSLQDYQTTISFRQRFQQTQHHLSAIPSPPQISPWANQTLLPVAASQRPKHSQCNQSKKQQQFLQRKGRSVPSQPLKRTAITFEVDNRGRPERTNQLQILQKYFDQKAMMRTYHVRNSPQNFHKALESFGFPSEALSKAEPFMPTNCFYERKVKFKDNVRFKIRNNCTMLELKRPAKIDKLIADESYDPSMKISSWKYRTITSNSKSLNSHKVPLHSNNEA